MGDKKEYKSPYWLDRNRFLVILLSFAVIFFTIMTLLYLKADEVTKDPCAICAERMGEKVTCTTGEFVTIQRVYYPNGTIVREETNGLQP